jgi:ribonuclease-3
MQNSNQKRGSSSQYYDNDRNKKQRPNNLACSNFTTQSRGGNQNGYGSSQQNTEKYKNKDNPALDYISRLPDPAKCEPCKLAAAERRTGLIALLDSLEAEETRPHGDMDVLHHARELRRLLSARASKTRSSEAKKALDEKRPSTDKYVSIPAYIEHKMTQAKDLPKLPHITEPHLEEAVFTHVSSHGVARIKGVSDPDQITYERLEFLGDAYIELISSRLIYSRLPHLDVPQQSYFREQLVKNETLGKFSNAYGLPDRLKHGGHMGESKAWAKVVADVFEAYVAAVVLSDPEGGFYTAENWLTELWAPQFLEFKEQIIENPQAKDDLARLVACKDVTLRYKEEREVVMENGVQKYSMGVYLTGWGYENEWLGSGEARNKGQAGVKAAMDAIRRNNAALEATTKKKRELLQQKREKGQYKQMEGKTDSATYSGSVTDTRSDSKPLEPHPNGSSWLEKEKKKKEKKERREKKKE